MEMCNSFQKTMKNDFIDAILIETAYVPLSYFMQCCNKIKDGSDGLPFNIGKAIKKNYQNIRPEKQVRRGFCVVCNGAGLVTETLFNPFLEWVTPCKCMNGDKFRWMEESTDSGFTRHLESRGVKFKRTQVAADSEDYSDF